MRQTELLTAWVLVTWAWGYFLYQDLQMVRREVPLQEVFQFKMYHLELTPYLLEVH